VSKGDPAHLPVGRNTLLLAGTLAAQSGMMQMVAAVSTLTFVLLTDIKGLLGVAPALVLGSAALAAFPAGRAMDRFGRMPVIRAGFVFCGLGAVLTGIGAHYETAAPAVVGFILIGLGNGQVLLTRGAASDMYPPERRARGVGLVLFGSVFGAILGPFVFTPLFGKDTEHASALATPWFAAAAFMVGGLALSLAVRVDPKRIAEIHEERAAVAAAGPGVGGEPPPPPAPPAPAQPLSVILRRPGVLPALLAALASFGVMVSVMNLTGYVVIDHGHSKGDLFPIISAHIVGMFGLVLVVGDIIDRVGKKQAQVFGLIVTAASSLGLIWVSDIAGTAILMFLLGIGWVFSFVAATTQLADLTAPSERGRLLGFSDLLSGATGATLAIVGGLAFTHGGVAALALLAAGFAVLPVPLIVLRRRAVTLQPAS
jgi:MFS family permease